MPDCVTLQSGLFLELKMQVLNHHIYEYKKGIRNLVLHTLNSAYRVKAEEKLKHNNISYLVREVSEKKINIFFGDKECIQVINSFGDKPLNEFTPEQDFILGTMLGYGRIEQCKRYLKTSKAALYSGTNIIKFNKTSA